MPARDKQYAGLPLVGLLIAGFWLVLALKLFFAAVLDLYSDEVFYWQASANPALAYSDLPFMTALLAGLGSALDPGNALAVRVPFLLLGSSLPLLVYWLALPLGDRRQALEAAALTLCLPLGGFMGLLAVPDVPLVFFGLLSLACFERALRLNAWRFWLGTGLFVALGLCTHYRFFLYPLAAILFLSLFPQARPQWRNPRLWLGMALASTGLIPILWFNLSNDLSSASFYFMDRHPWSFQASGLLHLFKQAGLVTPPLYAVLILTALTLYQRARQGELGAALLLSVALVNSLVYLVLAPWTDATSTSIHWPLSGYFPLLVAAPAALRQLFHWASARYGNRMARGAVAVVPAIGFIGTLVALAGIGSQAFQAPLQTVLGTGVLSNKMAGWQQFAAHTQGLIEGRSSNQSLQVVTDNYYTAAQVEFAGLVDDALTIDDDKAVRDGRRAQYRLWNKDETGLQQAIGRPLLYITEDSTLTVTDKHRQMESLCRHVAALQFIDGLELFNGDKRFSYYYADQIVTRQADETRARPCPFPARAWIDTPVDGTILRGDVTVNGWAFNEDIGIAEVHLLLNADMVQRLDYGIQRPDVVDNMNVTSDPNAPGLGFGGVFDSSSLTNGEYTLEIELVNALGHRSSYGARQIRIAN